MITLELYNSKSEMIRVDKTEFLTSKITLNGTLRNESSVINPTIIIEFNTTQEYVIVGTTENYKYVVDDSNKRIIVGSEMDNEIVKCNYAHIPEFNRWYYIDDIVSIRDGIWELSMSVDVLMSFKEQFLELNGFISRQEYFNNDFINERVIDDRLPFNDVPSTTIYNNQLSNYFLNSNQLTNEFCIAITTANDEPTNNDIGYSTGMNKTYLVTPYLYEKFSNVIYKQDFFSNWKFLFTDPVDCILSIKLFPINLRELCNYTEVKTIGVGSIDVAPIVTNEDFLCEVSNSGNKKLVAKISFPLEKSKLWLNLNPYTSFRIYLPYYGYYDVDMNNCLSYYVTKLNNTKLLNVVEYTDEYLYIYLTTDLLSGKCEYQIEFVTQITYSQPNNEDDNDSGIAGGTPYSSNISLTQEYNLLLDNLSFDLGVSIPVASDGLYKALLNTGLSLLGGAIKSSTNFKTSSSGFSETQHDTVIKHTHRKGELKSTTISGGGRDRIYNEKTSYDLLNLPNIILDTSNDMYSSMHYSTNVKNDCSGGWNIINRPNEFFLVDKSLIPIVGIIGNDYENEYNHIFGKPCGFYLKLGELNGYTEVGSIHLDNIEGITLNELNSLDTQLKSGVIL